MTGMKNIVIFTDGASKGNPGPGGYGAVVILPEGKVAELGGSELHTTNNRMELLGAAAALKEISKRKENVLVYTDSRYLIGGMTGWIYGWQKNGWKTKEKKEVLNKDLWEKLARLAESKKIKWNYVGGHLGVAGNERCDEIADAKALGKKPILYKGSLSKYKINVADLGHNAEKKKIKSNKSAKAYSYLSLVNGILKIDKTWPECEAKVKGQKGAKYKKAISEADEKEIIRNWGLNE
jgi:ribonuclease HI